MNIQTLYTATGHLQMRRAQEGREYPVVVLNRREHLLAPLELVLWSRLCWRFRDLDRLRREYETTAEETGLPELQRQAPSFEHALTQLVARGLIASGEGETQVDALYDLLSNLYITPIDDSFWNRLAAASKLVTVRHVPRAKVRGLFQKECTTDEERRILALSRQALLSTAELIKCEEAGVTDVSSSERVLETLYYDDVTTCYNIAHLMRNSPMRDPVVLAVSNLFLRKQIVFQRACL